VIGTTIICALACVVLVDAERRQREPQRWIAKIVASCAFVLTGCLAVWGHDRRADAFQSWILVGLGLGLVGDVALLYKRGFLAGLGAFLLGHTAYVIAVGAILPPALWLDRAGMAAVVPAVVGAAVLATLWKNLGKLALPVVAYVAVIIAMVIAAVAATRAQLTPPSFAIGAALFFASDIAVARNKFVAPTFTNRLWGLPAYFAAQLLIAWSLCPT
jgi:uncharacterized membrane protein YhhN